MTHDAAVEVARRLVTQAILDALRAAVARERERCSPVPLCRLQLAQRPAEQDE